MGPRSAFHSKHNSGKSPSFWYTWTPLHTWHLNDRHPFIAEELTSWSRDKSYASAQDLRLGDIAKIAAQEEMTIMWKGTLKPKHNRWPRTFPLERSQVVGPQWQVAEDDETTHNWASIMLHYLISFGCSSHRRVRLFSSVSCSLLWNQLPIVFNMDDYPSPAQDDQQ